MTRNEFIETITEWTELLEFCNDFDCSVCEDIIDDDELDEYVNEDIRTAVGDDSWRTIRDYLDDIPTGYDYYRRDGMFDYTYMDDGDDFDEYKDRALEWGDDYGLWDDEEDDEDGVAENDEEEVPEEEEPPVEEEDFSIRDLIGMCGVMLVTIQQDEASKQQEEDKEFAQLFNMDGRKILT